MEIPHSYLFPQIHETWHFILKPNIRMLGDTCDEPSHLSDFDLLATKRGERDIWFFNKQFELINLEGNITSDFEGHFCWWIEWMKVEDEEEVPNILQSNVFRVFFFFLTHVMICLIDLLR
jgi:hypothetical protein